MKHAEGRPPLSESIGGYMPRRWPVLLAVALVGLAFVPGIERQGVDVAELGDRPLDGLGIVLIVALGAPVALLLRWPGLSLAVVGAAFCAYQLLRYPTSFAALGLLVAVAGAAALLQRFRLLTATLAVVVYILFAVSLTLIGSPSSPLDFGTFGLVLILLWALGSWLRARGVAAAERRVNVEREIVTAERARIARELHDVVTHHVTAMVVQADAAQYTVNDFERATTNLSQISNSGRAALTDLRAMLGALDGSPDSSREPAAVEVRELVEHATSAGQPVELDERGVPRALTGAAGLAIARVVQEGLTNALKHATGAKTMVRIEYGETDVKVEIRTDGSSNSGIGRGSGRGLVGLRERVEVIGGELHAGPDADGFSVCARVPA